MVRRSDEFPTEPLNCRWPAPHLMTSSAQVGPGSAKGFPIQLDTTKYARLGAVAKINLSRFATRSSKEGSKMKTLMVALLCVPGLLAQDKDKDKDKSAIVKATAACGPDNVKFDVTHPEASQPPAVPETGKALVFVIEQENSICDSDSCPTTTKVGLDGSWIGANRGNSYFSFAMAPGEHHLCVKWQSRFSSANRVPALAGFTAEAGKTYYFRARFISSKLQMYLDLDPINDDQGKFFVAFYPQSIAHAKP